MGMDPTFTNIMIAVMALMSFVIVAINSGCIYIIYSSKVLRQKTASILVSSILLLHLLQGCFVIPFYAAKKAKVTDNFSKNVICDGFRFTYMLTFYGACVNVLLISGDRLLAVKLMTSYKTVVTKRCMIIVTVALWLYMLLLCLIPFIPTAKKSPHCTYNQPNWWTIAMLFTNTTVPYVVAIASYVYIFVKLVEMAQKQQEKARLTMEDQGNESKTHLNALGLMNVLTKAFNNKKNKHKDPQKKMKALYQVTRLTFMIILAYGLTWTPSIIYYSLLQIAPSIFTEEYNTSPAESYVTFFIKFITFFDAIVTPILLCFHHKDFKKEFDKRSRHWTVNSMRVRPTRNGEEMNTATKSTS